MCFERTRLRRNPGLLRGEPQLVRRRWVARQPLALLVLLVQRRANGSHAGHGDVDGSPLSGFGRAALLNPGCRRDLAD